MINRYINTSENLEKREIVWNIAMSKARRIRKISVFTSGGKFSVFTLSYVNTALNQSAFRIHKCYIIKLYNKNVKSFAKISFVVRRNDFSTPFDVIMIYTKQSTPSAVDCSKIAVIGLSLKWRQRASVL